jgi:predicted DNA-binding transcriptional regulator AlpA
MDPEFEFVYGDLKKRFDGRLAIKTGEMAELIDYKQGTIYNKISKGTFPIKPIRADRRLRFRLIDIAKYLSGGE